jgi:hypothetical protein
VNTPTKKVHEVKILQIHNARPEFVNNITAINQSESSILNKYNQTVVSIHAGFLT